MKCPIIGVVFVETTAHSERICWDTPLEPKVVREFLRLMKLGVKFQSSFFGVNFQTPPTPQKNGEKIRNLVNKHILF